MSVIEYKCQHCGSLIYYQGTTEFTHTYHKCGEGITGFCLPVRIMPNNFKCPEPILGKPTLPGRNSSDCIVLDNIDPWDNNEDLSQSDEEE